MAYLYKAVVTLPAVSGIPDDAAQNTFHFAKSSGSSFLTADASDIADNLEQFYNDVSSTTGEYLAKWLSHTRSRAADAVLVEVYGHASPYSSAMLWGSPQYASTFTLGAVAGSTTPYPAEVAIVGSYHGDLTGILEESGDTRPRARRRGRIYLGPLNTGCGNVVSGTNQLIVHANAAQTLCDRMEGLRNASTTFGVPWVVYSPTAGDTHAVTAGWVDNAFDTQRRRGEEATIRLVWS